MVHVGIERPGPLASMFSIRSGIQELRLNWLTSHPTSAFSLCPFFLSSLTYRIISNENSHKSSVFKLSISESPLHRTIRQNSLHPFTNLYKIFSLLKTLLYPKPYLKVISGLRGKCRDLQTAIFSLTCQAWAEVKPAYFPDPSQFCWKLSALHSRANSIIITASASFFHLLQIYHLSIWHHHALRWSGHILKNHPCSSPYLNFSPSHINPISPISFRLIFFFSLHLL